MYTVSSFDWTIHRGYSSSSSSSSKWVHLE